jgi:hypothetical protein
MRACSPLSINILVDHFNALFIDDGIDHQYQLPIGFNVNYDVVSIMTCTNCGQPSLNPGLAERVRVLRILYLFILVLYGPDSSDWSMQIISKLE